MDAKDKAMLEQMKQQIKDLWREHIHLDFIEGGMTARLVPEGKMSGDHLFEPHSNDHFAALRRLREICSPLFGREAVIIGPLGLPSGDGWVEYQGEYGGHGVTGLICGLKGFVLDQTDVNKPSRVLQVQRFRYCLMVATQKDQIQESPFGIDWQRHPAEFTRVLVPVRGLQEGWWHEVVRFNAPSRFVEDPWT